MAPHRRTLGILRTQYEEIRQEVRGRLDPILSQVQAIYRQVEGGLQGSAPSIEDYPLPEGAEADEPDDVLFDSRREYEDQIGHYKRFQHGTGSPAAPPRPQDGAGRHFEGQDGV
jgi:hypothetical protein